MRSVLRRFFLVMVALSLLGPAHLSVRGQQPVVPTAGGQASTPRENAPEKKKEEQDENEAYRHSPTVVKLGSMVGMNPEQAATAFTLFNFAVLAIAVGYFLLKALPKTFRNRNAAIQKHLVDARTATEEATARLSSVEERLSKLDQQIAAMRAQADEDSKRDQQRIHVSIQDEKAKIVAAAEQEIASAATLAQRQIQQYAAELAIEQAERKLLVTAEADRLLVESFAQRLAANDGGRN